MRSTSTVEGWISILRPLNSRKRQFFYHSIRVLHLQHDERTYTIGRGLDLDFERESAFRKCFGKARDMLSDILVSDAAEQFERCLHCVDVWPPREYLPEHYERFRG